MNTAKLPRLFFRGNHHDHLAALKAWVLFYRTDFLEILLHTLQQLHAQFLMGHFTTAKAQGDLGFIPAKIAVAVSRYS